MVMRKRVPTFKTVDLEALVNTLEPDRLTKPVLVYNTRRPRYERPLQPGQEYPWVKK